MEPKNLPGRGDLVIWQNIHPVDSAHPNSKNVVMLGQGGTWKIQQRPKWKLSWVENCATGEPCCTDKNLKKIQIDSAPTKSKSMVMLGQGGTCKIQQRHKWKLSWVENRATGEPCCTDDRGNTYGTTSMNLITQSGVPPATPAPLVWQAQSSAEVRSSKRKQDLIIIIRQLHMSPGYVTSGGRWDWQERRNREDRQVPELTKISWYPSAGGLALK